MIGSHTPAGSAGTLGGALTAFRDGLIVKAEIARASRPADEAAPIFGTREVALPADLVRKLCAFAEAHEPGDDTMLPEELSAEVLRHLGPEQPAQPPRLVALGASERRAQIALGRAGVLRTMLRLNDLAMVDGPVAEFMGESGLHLSPDLTAVFRRHATAVMAEVETENARRDRGIYPPWDLDPCLSLSVRAGPAATRWSPIPPESPGDAWSAQTGATTGGAALMASELSVGRGVNTAMPAPEEQGAARTCRPPAAAGVERTAHAPASADPTRAGLAPSGEAAAGPGSGLTVSEVIAGSISRMENATTKKRNAKSLRDYGVAKSLFLELMGDMPVAAVTTDVCEQFRELLGSVPAMHGKSGAFAGMNVQESIAKADADDDMQEMALVGGGDPDTASQHARLSYGTINKHLTSLQTCMGSRLTRDHNGQTPLLAVRFSKAEVKANPAFRRTQLTDERLVAIFHGPAFTGFGDGDNRRFTPGERLVLDGCYWVPLLALYSGMCLEEALQLRPADVATEDGIPAISIGAIHDGKAAVVKTPARVRTIPVHPTLIELGFLDHVASVRRAGGARLFPGLTRGGPDGRFGHDFTQWWTAYRRAVGAYARGQDFHSLRHGVNRRLIKAKVPLPVVKRILGHSEGNDMNLAVYYGEVDLADMAEAISTIRYPCLDVRMLQARRRSLAG